uniref:Uncharacterized protein n=1 Tax=Arundo donax TaxID=35708 RepID=A0A0A9AX44_ARUDO
MERWREANEPGAEQR